MSSQHQSLSERVQRTFEQHGRTWRDYVLLTDVEPPSILAVSVDGVALLHIDDPALATACREFLVEHGARTFSTFDALNRAFGVRREVRPRKIDDDA